MFGLFIAFVISACSLADNISEEACGEFTNVAFSGFPLSCNYTVKNSPLKPTIFIANTQEKMDSYFTKHANSCSNSGAPSIDFTKYVFVGIFSGEKPTGGYGIKITSIVENKCNIVINFYEHGPQPGEAITQVITNPSDYVLIPITTKPIYFNKTAENPDKIIIGSFDGTCTGANTCQQFYQLNDYNILNYQHVVYGSYEFTQYQYNAVTKRGDYTLFLKTIPTEILNIKGQTKTYGSLDTGDKKGVYFELHQGAAVTKIYIDNDNTADQSAEIKAFKTIIQDKITTLK